MFIYDHAAASLLSLPLIPVDALRAALASPTVQSQLSATVLYNAIEEVVYNLEHPVTEARSGNPPAVPCADPPPRRAPLSDAERKHWQEFREEYYLRRKVTNIWSGDAPPFVPNSTNMGKLRSIKVQTGEIGNRLSPSSVPVTVGVLAEALINLGLQNEISATTLYHALEVELRERGELPPVKEISMSAERPEPPTQDPTGHRSGRIQLTDAQRRRLKEAGDEYGRWLAAHPGYWSRDYAKDNVEAEQKYS